MIDNNIMKSLGIGSGIDSPNLIKQLTELERLGPQKRIDDKREKTEAQISDFASMASSLDTLKKSFTTLVEREGLFSKAAAYSDSDAIVPTKLDTKVQPGVYAVEVKEIARSQSLSFVGFDDPTAKVGLGKLTFDFGTWDRTTPAFNADAEAESFSIEIDSSNNTLEGLRDTINAADKGVQASIVFDGAKHRLVMTAPSGVKNEIQITVEESSATPTNTDGDGLSRFAFNTGIASLAAVENQSGADALLVVNGLTVTRETNSVDDVISGLTLDIMKPAPGSPINITISHDKAFAEQNVRDFVAAYNTFLDEVKPLFKADEKLVEAEEKFGSLKGDALAKSVLSQFRSTIASAVPGLTDSNFSALTNVGIRTERDGSLSINETDFTKAFAERFTDVQKLFAPSTNSSSTEITVNKYGKQTKAGSYDVVITTPPTKGAYAAGAAAVVPLDTTGMDYSFNLAVNGVASNLITLPEANYGNLADLTAALQTAINSDTNLSANGLGVSVSADASGAISITSNRFGTSSSVTVTSASTLMVDNLKIGAGIGTSTAGVNVAGTVNGVEAFGVGNVLLPKLGEPAEGLSLIIGENATSGRVDFSRGFAGQIDEVAKQFLQKNGLLDKREDELNRKISGLADEEKTLDRRVTAFQDRMMRQFIAMERILNGLNTQGGFLENLIDRLPFTAKK